MIELCGIKCTKCGASHAASGEGTSEFVREHAACTRRPVFAVRISGLGESEYVTSGNVFMPGTGRCYPARYGTREDAQRLADLCPPQWAAEVVDYPSI